VKVAIVLCGAIAAGFAGAIAVVGLTHERPTQPAVLGHVAPTVQRPASSSSADATQPDPDGKGPPWSVIVFKGPDGRQCAAFGRNVDGRRSYEGRTCVALGQVPAGLQITRGSGPDSRTIVHGLAGPTVRAISVTSPAGTETLDIGPHGGFIKVFDPSVTIQDIHVDAALKDGSAVQLM
jgi:hypothetical protein